MLRARILTAAIGIPLVLALVFLGEPWLSLFLGVVAFLALVEIVSLLDAGGFRPPQVLTMVAGMAVAAAGLTSENREGVGGVAASLLTATDPPGLVAAAFVASVLMLALAAFTRGDPRDGFLTWAMSSFGVGYVGLLLPTLALVGHLAPPSGGSSTAVGAFGLASGTAWMLTLVLIVWGYDTGAYFTGRLVGRRRLIEHISPAKTIEGFVGGLVVATLAAGIGAALVGLEPWHPLVMGPLVGLAAQAGDLAESMLKRAADRKESGFLFPGHGGMLDRIDSATAVLPVAALLVPWLKGTA